MAAVGEELVFGKDAIDTLGIYLGYTSGINGNLMGITLG